MRRSIVAAAVALGALAVAPAASAEPSAVATTGGGVSAAGPISSFSDVVDDYEQAQASIDALQVRFDDLSARRDALASRMLSLTTRSAELTSTRERQQEDIDAAARDVYMRGVSAELSLAVDVLSSRDPMDTARAATYVDTATGQLSDRIAATVEASAVVASDLADTRRQYASVQVRRASMAERIDASIAKRTEIAQVLTELAFPAPSTGPQTAVSDQGCPTSAPPGSFRARGVDVFELCAKSVRQAATPSAALAIIEAFTQLGAPYACEGVGRLEPGIYDCSSFVSRAYSEGAQVPVASEFYAPSTRSMMPWDGYAVNPWFAFVEAQQTRPGDLVVQRTCTEPPCDYQHVVMLLADGYQIHTSSCGDVANVSPFAGFDDPSFAVARRVLAPSASAAAAPDAVAKVLARARNDVRAGAVAGGG